MSTQALLNALPEIIAQLLGFLLVFWILKKFAFGKFLALIDERRKTIADEFQNIEDQKKQIGNLEKEYRAKIQDIEKEARHKIQEAIGEGSRMAQEIKDKARSDSLKQLERTRADIKQEFLKAKAVLRKQMVEISTQMAERILRKNLNAKQDEAFVDDLMKEAEKV